MPWLPTILLAAAGLLGLAAVLTRALLALRRLSAAASMVHADVSGRTGMLRARWAALRIGIRERMARCARPRGESPGTIDAGAS